MKNFDVKLNKNATTFETINDIILLICKKCNIEFNKEEDENQIKYEFINNHK